MKEYVPYLLALAVGVFTTLEVSINSKLGRIITPPLATLHSLIIGVLLFFSINMLTGTLPQYRKILQIRPVWLIGGIFGALIIYFSTKTVPKLGITTTLILVVAAEVLTGLFIESFITKEHMFTLMKMLGLAFLLIGIYIIVD